MAKKKDKTSRKGKGGKRKELEKKAKAAKAARKQQKKDAKKAAAPEPAPGALAEAPIEAVPREPVDQVKVLKLALRDTEAKLVAAEHRLRQVQQQLDDERRALAEATGSLAEEQEAIVDAAVAETVAEAVVAAELAAATTSGDPGAVDAAEVAAATLEDAADAIDAALADEAGQEADRSGGRAAGDLTPPLPDQGPDDEPNESWTLVRLRKEADRRGVTGVGNLSKAALIERLRR